MDINKELTLYFTIINKRISNYDNNSLIKNIVIHIS